MGDDGKSIRSAGLFAKCKVHDVLAAALARLVPPPISFSRQLLQNKNSTGSKGSSSTASTRSRQSRASSKGGKAAAVAAGDAAGQDDQNAAGPQGLLIFCSMHHREKGQARGGGHQAATGADSGRHLFQRAVRERAPTRAPNAPTCW